MNNINKSQNLTKFINKFRRAVSDQKALENPMIFPVWTINKEYKENDRVRYNDELYKVIQAHNSSADATPDTAPDFFIKMV